MRCARRRAGVRLTGSLLVGSALVMAGCGGGSDDGDPAEADAGTPVADDDGGDGDGGEMVLSLGGDIPDYFPSDFYIPEGMTVRGVTRSGDAISLNGTFESGDLDAIQADMVAGLEAAGYELLSNEDVAAFVKNGVGRVRVRTSEFGGELTVSVDIDTWSDEQLDELRALFVEETVVSGRAVAVVGDETFEAEGECLLQGANRSFFSSDGSISIQINETLDPAAVHADVTTPDGTVFLTENGADLEYDSTDSEMSASGDMVELYNDAAGTMSFSMTATCDT